MPNTTDLVYCGPQFVLQFVAFFRSVNPLRMCQLWLSDTRNGLQGGAASVTVGTILINGNRSFPTSPSNPSNWHDDGQSKETAKLGPLGLFTCLPAVKPQCAGRVSVATSLKQVGAHWFDVVPLRLLSLVSRSNYLRLAVSSLSKLSVISEYWTGKYGRGKRNWVKPWRIARVSADIRTEHL